MAECGGKAIRESGDSSSDEGEDVPYGYEPLPQDDGGEPASEDSGAGSSVEEDLVDDGTAATGVAKAVQTGSVGKASMKSGEVSAILSLMSTFQLPSSAIPEWAKVVPEEVWKKELVSGLNEGQVPAAIACAKKQKKKKKRRKNSGNEEQASLQEQDQRLPGAEKQRTADCSSDLPRSGSDWAAMGILKRTRKLSFGDEDDLRKELTATLANNEPADANADSVEVNEKS